MYRSPRILFKHSVAQFYFNNLNLPYHQLQNVRFLSSLHSGGRSQLPELCIEKSNGTYEKIPEEDLYRYTRHRWLFNEQNELSKRYVKFNLQQLVNVAVSVSPGARYCTRVLKSSEGLHNKAFILTMDNGTEVFVKLPNPNAGPAHYTTASEVATRELLRDVFKIPVPRILARSSDAANNPVGAEYIVEEKAPGVRLGYLWSQWPRDVKLKLIRQIVDIENTLTTKSFTKYGCIYFKEDLRSLTGDAEDLSIDNGSPVDLGRFSIGALTSAELWANNRGDMKLDRGPWQHSYEYTQALGQNEIAWIKSYASPRMNHYRSSQDYEHPNDGLALLTQYMHVASHLVPPLSDDAAASKVFWHPDLHLDNVFVDPDTHEITRIVDWQSACIAPLFYQYSVPRMFRHHRPVREKTISIFRKPVWLVSGVWENKDLFFLRQSLISLATHWEELFPDSQSPCPIKFTKADIELHSKEEENMDGVGHMLALFRDQDVLPVDGMVEPKDYETASENSRKFKDVFIGLAKDEAERELFAKLWPYQEN